MALSVDIIFYRHFNKIEDILGKASDLLCRLTLTHIVNLEIDLAMETYFPDNLFPPYAKNYPSCF